MDQQYRRERRGGLGGYGRLSGGEWAIQERGTLGRNGAATYPKRADWVGGSADQKTLQIGEL